MSCYCRTRSRLRARCGLSPGCGLSTRCGLLTWSRLRTSCGRLRLTGRTRLLRLHRFILGRPVFIHANVRRLIGSGLVLVRASGRRFILRGPGLVGAICSRGVLVRATCGCSISSCLTLGALVGCSRLSGRYHPMTVKLRRLDGGSDCRPAVIHRRQQFVVPAGGLLML